MVVVASLQWRLRATKSHDFYGSILASRRRLTAVSEATGE